MLKKHTDSKLHVIPLYNKYLLLSIYAYIKSLEHGHTKEIKTTRVHFSCIRLYNVDLNNDDGMHENGMSC